MARSVQTYYGTVKGVSYGASYNFGTVAIGYDKFKNENGIGTIANLNPLGEQVNNAVAITKKYGATYSLDANQTLGIVKSVTDTSGAAMNGLTETVVALQYGYNFGPVAVSATVSKFNNLYDAYAGPTDQENGRMAQFRVTTKF